MQFRQFLDGLNWQNVAVRQQLNGLKHHKRPKNPAHIDVSLYLPCVKITHQAIRYHPKNPR